MHDNRITISAFERELQRYKRYGEQAMAQVERDEDRHRQINPLQNAIATIVQHLHGNMVSRFTDFLSSDGEKPTRDRDGEFIDRQLSRVQLMELWEQGWRCVFDALASLSDDDLARTITIRGEPHTVAMALARQTAHYAWHVAQIALIAKHVIGGEGWSYLTIPPGGSAAFNEKMRGRGSRDDGAKG